MGVILGNGCGGGRFLKQWAVVILGMAVLGLTSLLFIMPRYRMQQQAMSMAKEAVIKNNMRALHVALAQYMAEDGRGYPVSFESENTGGAKQVFDHLKSTTKRMQNPFDPGMPAVAVSRKEPPFWPAFKPGQVVYVPLGIGEGVAAGYVIYGVGMKGPISTVLDYRPEAILERGPSMEKEVGQ